MSNMPKYNLPIGHLSHWLLSYRWLFKSSGVGLQNWQLSQKRHGFPRIPGILKEQAGNPGNIWES
jgi:hypothetical protein